MLKAYFLSQYRYFVKQKRDENNRGIFATHFQSCNGSLNHQACSGPDWENFGPRSFIEFFYKKIPLSGRVEYVTGQWVSE